MISTINMSNTLTTINNNLLNLNDIVKINQSIQEFYNDALIPIYWILGASAFIIGFVVPFVYYRFQKKDFKDYVKTTKEDIINDFNEKIDSKYDKKIASIETENIKKIETEFIKNKTEIEIIKNEYEKNLKDEITKIKNEARADLFFVNANFNKSINKNDEALKNFLRSLYLWIKLNDKKKQDDVIEELKNIEGNFGLLKFNNAFKYSENYNEEHTYREYIKKELTGLSYGMDTFSEIDRILKVIQIQCNDFDTPHN